MPSFPEYTRQKMLFDFHIHSKYSHDSLLQPKKIVRMSKKKGLSGVAVTDHNTIRGGIETFRLSNFGLMVIVGAEIKTELGDIIGLFLNEEIISHNALEVIDEIRDQGGIVVLPHPFRKGKNVAHELLNKIDVIEGFNARSEHIANLRAQEYAKVKNLPAIAGSDAHISWEIGRGKSILPYVSAVKDVRNAILTGKLEITGKESPYIVHGFSVGIEKIREKQYSELLKIYSREFRRIFK